MAATISIDDEAPDFDLTSTEDVILMLRDEVPRSMIVLYFFDSTESERARGDLAALAGAASRLAEAGAYVRAVSPAALAELKALQKELSLPFPLLRDDRGFSAAYGVAAAEEGEEVAPALFLVDRRQKICWLANPLGSIDGAVAAVEKALETQPSPTTNYPRSVVNRWVDRWVN